MLRQSQAHLSATLASHHLKCKMQNNSSFVHQNSAGQPGRFPGCPRLTKTSKSWEFESSTCAKNASLLSKAQEICLVKREPKRLGEPYQTLKISDLLRCAPRL